MCASLAHKLKSGKVFIVEFCESLEILTISLTSYPYVCYVQSMEIRCVCIINRWSPLLRDHLTRLNVIEGIAGV